MKKVKVLVIMARAPIKYYPVTKTQMENQNLSH